MNRSVDILSIDNFNFQRNGVSGRSFFEMIITFDNNGKIYTAVATMEYDDDEGWDHSSCRVTTFMAPGTSWRGDVFALEIAQLMHDPISRASPNFTLDGFIPDADVPWNYRRQYSMCLEHNIRFFPVDNGSGIVGWEWREANDDETMTSGYLGYLGYFDTAAECIENAAAYIKTFL